MKTYADTSLLFSLYSTDSHSPKADAWRQPVAKLVGVTEFCTFDTRQSDLAAKVRMTVVTP